MYRLLTTLVVSCFSIALTGQDQTLDQLKAQKEETEAEYTREKAEADSLKGEIDKLNSQILELSGWSTGFSGLIGFDFNRSNNWANNPNPDARSSALNLGLTTFANKVTSEYFWNNKLIVRKSWQDVDLTEADQEVEDDGLFDNGTIDIFNLNTLYGKSLTNNLSLSAMAELSTSLGNFIDPGTFDIGIGSTWKPIPELVVTVHPLNYHVAFSGVENVDTEGLWGAKLRADLTHTFPQNISWSSTLTSFIPYRGNDPTLFEYTFLNTLAFSVWEGIGIGFSLGIRNAEFESEDTQTFYTVGLTYVL